MKINKFIISVIITFVILSIQFVQMGYAPSHLQLIGDLNNDGKVDIIDLGILLSSWGRTDRPPADLNQDGKVDIIDLGILLSNWGKGTTTTTTVPSTTTTAPGGWLDQKVCYPEKGGFSLNINNPWLPFPVGMVHVLEGGGLKVQVSVLDQTEVVCGVTTRVVEEREWQSGKLIEVSRNYFVQASDGTVCYYGENVYDGSGNPAGGTWRACLNGAKAGIMMPPNPVVGMKWIIEDAQASGAYEDAVVQSIGETFVTPAGTFTNTLYIIEDFGNSFKRYAQGVGMIFDDGIKLTQK